MDFRLAWLAACMAHVEGAYSQKTIAHQRRNPGNIETKPGTIDTYDNFGFGFAMLYSDIEANKGTTLREFLNKYAPPLENDTTMYLTVVSTLSGIGQDELL